MSISINSLILILQNLLPRQKHLFPLLIEKVMHTSVRKTLRPIQWHLSLKPTKRTPLLQSWTIHIILQQLSQPLYRQLLPYPGHKHSLMKPDRGRAELEEPSREPLMRDLDYFQGFLLVTLREETVELLVSCFLIDDKVWAVNYPGLDLLEEGSLFVALWGDCPAQLDESLH